VSDLEQACDITCPHCWETITVMLDLSAGSQSYFEDCSVCCRSIEVSYESGGGELLSVTAVAAG
jgi:transcription elongation factor Elf1